jgi:hypothetical protein
LNKYEEKVKLLNENDKILKFLRKEIYKEKINKDRGLKLDDAIELMKYVSKIDLIEKIKKFEFPKFQISANDILNHKMLDVKTSEMISVEDYCKGSLLRVNYVLKNLRNKWIESNFSLSFNDLLNEINVDYLSKFISKK